VLVSVPIPSTLHSITSPTFSHCLGFIANPTPDGVPVAITSPGSSVRPADSDSIVRAMLKIMSDVFASWRLWPLTSSSIRSLCGSAISSAVTM